MCAPAGHHLSSQSLESHQTLQFCFILIFEWHLIFNHSNHQKASFTKIVIKGKCNLMLKLRATSSHSIWLMSSIALFLQILKITMYPCELTTAPQIPWSTVWEQGEVLSSRGDIVQLLNLPCYQFCDFDKSLKTF